MRRGERRTILPSEVSGSPGRQVKVTRRWWLEAALAGSVGAAAAGWGPVVIAKTPTAMDARRVAQQDVGTSTWGDLPQGASFEPLTRGTVDDLLVASGLVAIARITAEAGASYLFYYNDVPGVVGPRMIFVEEGTVSSGPLTVSPGSSPGPTLLMRTATEGEGAKPAVLTPGSKAKLQPGDLIFFPADTAYAVGNDYDGPGTVYLEIAVFPIPALLHEEGEVFGKLVAQPLAVDLGVEAAFPPTPPLVAVGRLSLLPGAGIPSHATVGNPTVLSVEAGVLGLTTQRGKVQVVRVGVAPPGEFVEATNETTFTASDALMLPPDALGALRNVGDEPLSLLSLVIDPTTGTTNKS